MAADQLRDVTVWAASFAALSPCPLHRIKALKNAHVVISGCLLPGVTDCLLCCFLHRMVSLGSALRSALRSGHVEV